MGTAETKPKSAVADAADRVRAAILRGEIPAGDDLPGERDLALRLGVSRLTLRSALTRLETEGLVRPVQGSGTRVLDFRERGGVDLIGALAALTLEGGDVPIELLRDLLELRRMIAVELIALVTERATVDELLALRAHVSMQRGLIGDAGRFRDADLAFARMIVRASKNLALELLFNTVARVIESHTGLAIAFQANAEQTIAVYGRILELLDGRDARRAANVTRKLLSHLDRRTLDRIEQITGAIRSARREGSHA